MQWTASKLIEKIPLKLAVTNNFKKSENSNSNHTDFNNHRKKNIYIVSAFHQWTGKRKWNEGKITLSWARYLENWWH